MGGGGGGGESKQTQAISRRGKNGTTQGLWADARAEGRLQRCREVWWLQVVAKEKKNLIIISEKGRRWKAGGGWIGLRLVRRWNAHRDI